MNNLALDLVGCAAVYSDRLIRVHLGAPDRAQCVVIRSSSERVRASLRACTHAANNVLKRQGLNYKPCADLGLHLHGHASFFARVSSSGTFGRVKRYERAMAKIHLPERT